MQTIGSWLGRGLAAAGLMALGAASAQSVPKPDMGKLLATGGVSQVEGAGGGGLTPWALITGYGTRDSYGANAHYTVVRTGEYALDTYGVAVGLMDRVELSYARQAFRGTGRNNPLDDVTVRQDIMGLKVKVAGDAVYDQDRWLPQIAVGAQIKSHQGISGGILNGLKPRDLGARDNSGVDYYVSATKILLDQSLLINGTLRATRANQFGLLGFGGDVHNHYRLAPELSVAYLFSRHVAAGLEYRAKPRSLRLASDEDAYDAFVAYFPTKNVSMTLAYVNLGRIVEALNPQTQKGPYLSVQVGF